jgi:hypothetical protein
MVAQLKTFHIHVMYRVFILLIATLLVRILFSSSPTYTKYVPRIQGHWKYATLQNRSLNKRITLSIVTQVFMLINICVVLFKENCAADLFLPLTELHCVNMRLLLSQQGLYIATEPAGAVHCYWASWGCALLLSQLGLYTATEPAGAVHCYWASWGCTLLLSQLGLYIATEPAGAVHWY